MVQRSCSTKLLGVEIDEKQDWKEHFNSLLNSLNKRTFAIRRISNKIPKIEVIKVVQSIWMSKLRYGLQLCNQVRTKTEDPTNSLMKSVQVAQNKMLRMLDRISLKDHVTSKSCDNLTSKSSGNLASNRFKVSPVIKTPIRPILKVSSSEPRSNSASQTDISAVSPQGAKSKMFIQKLEKTKATTIFIEVCKILQLKNFEKTLFKPLIK